MTQATLREKAISKVKEKGPPAGSQKSPVKKAAAVAKILAYYDANKKTFWGLNGRGVWMDQTETSLRRLLRSMGFSPDREDDNGLNEVEQQLLRIQQNHDVDYAGPLAGYQSGFFEIASSRVLVTRGPSFPAIKAGKYDTLDRFVRTLLKDQTIYFLGWLRSAVQSLRAGPPWRPGQMLALAGPSGCGKSLLQSLITEILGGRVAKPYRYLTGEDKFNSELFGAEHLAIEDEAASTDLRTRRHFGAQLKNLIVNEVQKNRGHYRGGISLTPFWRVSISLNEETENLMVLPPLDDSLKDKIILLKATPAELPFSTDNLEERKRFRERLTAEIPAFLAALREWRIPQKLKDKRYGITAWQNPELTQELESLAPEFRLLNLIDALGVVSDFNLEWTGSSTELERALREKDKTGEVARLLSYPTACGVYLSRLLTKFPQRVEAVPGKNHQKTWTLRH